MPISGVPRVPEPRWKLDSGRIAKKQTEGDKWTWAGAQAAVQLDFGEFDEISGISVGNS